MRNFEFHMLIKMQAPTPSPPLGSKQPLIDPKDYDRLQNNPSPNKVFKSSPS